MRCSQGSFSRCSRCFVYRPVIWTQLFTSLRTVWFTRQQDPTKQITSSQVCLNMSSNQTFAAEIKIKTSKSKKCHVCDSDQNNKNFGQHMESHSEDLKRFKFSSNMIDSCKTSCKLCGKLIPLQHMRIHTKTAHEMPITEYKTKFNQIFYDIVEKVFHRYSSRTLFFLHVNSLPVILLTCIFLVLKLICILAHCTLS